MTYFALLFICFYKYLGIMWRLRVCFFIFEDKEIPHKYLKVSPDTHYKHKHFRYLLLSFNLYKDSIYNLKVEAMRAHNRTLQNHFLPYFSWIENIRKITKIQITWGMSFIFRYIPPIPMIF